jgi:hypothetical protein
MIILYYNVLLEGVKMTKEDILEIINKEGLFRFNIFNDHPQKANEVIHQKEDTQYSVFTTDEKNIIKDNVLYFSDEKEAVDKFIYQLHKLKDLYYSAFIGEKYIYYYKEKFNKRQQGKIFISWKWPPFFLGYGWLIYRKMYFETIIMFSIIVITGIIVVLSGANEQRVRDVYDTMRIITALLGNSLYFTKMNKTIKKLENIKEEEHMKYLEKHGHTNLKLAIIIEIILVALAILPIII